MKISHQKSIFSLILAILVFSGCILQVTPKRKQNSFSTNSGTGSSSLIKRLDTNNYSSFNSPISGEKYQCIYRDFSARIERQVIIVFNNRNVQFLLPTSLGNIISDFALEEMGEKDSTQKFNVTNISENKLISKASLSVLISEILQWRRFLDLEFSFDFNLLEGKVTETLYSTSQGEFYDSEDPYTSLEFYSCHPLSS